MPNSLILIADQARATFYTVTSPRGPLEQVEQLRHPQARDRAQDPLRRRDRGAVAQRL